MNFRGRGSTYRVALYTISLKNASEPRKTGLLAGFFTCVSLWFDVLIDAENLVGIDVAVARWPVVIKGFTDIAVIVGDQPFEHACSIINIESRIFELLDGRAIGETWSVDALESGGDTVTGHHLHEANGTSRTIGIRVAPRLLCHDGGDEERIQIVNAAIPAEQPST